VASPKFKQAHADALNSLEEQYERLMQLAQSVRDSWLLIEADDAHLMHSCRKLDDWLVRYVVSNSAKEPSAGGLPT
jgi:hypothetical protein